MNRPINFSVSASIIVIAFVISATMVLDHVQADEATQPAVAAGADAGPLKIKVTAVQGGVQYRTGKDQKWQALAVGADLTEGVEFRTGPRGTIQFTVGTDQVFRVDRLSVVKVLRANLTPDGTIRTDVGMTYGRVSKDVDQPSRPHQDTIVTPVSTLAVRGTHVAMYDQPPYEPEAVSLTGKAIYHNRNGHLVPLGGPGTGVAKVGGLDDGPVNFQLNNSQVNPQGTFSGLTPSELTTITNLPGFLPPNVNLPPAHQLTGGMTVMQQINPNPTVQTVGGSLTFEVDWFDDDTNSKVNLVVVSPSGSETTISGTSSGGQGTDRVGFGSGFTSSGKYEDGTYTVAETLSNPGSAGTVDTSLSVSEMADEGTSGFASGTGAILQSGSAGAAYRVTVPVGENSITLIAGDPDDGDSFTVQKKRHR